MNIKELRVKSPEELARLAGELRAQVHEGRFQLALRQAGKLQSVREARKDIARIKTLCRASRPSSS